MENGTNANNVGGYAGFQLDRFIAEYVVKRPESMFLEDIQNNKKQLQAIIQGKSVLVIGGA